MARPHPCHLMTPPVAEPLTLAWQTTAQRFCRAHAGAGGMAGYCWRIHSISWRIAIASMPKRAISLAALKAPRRRARPRLLLFVTVPLATPYSSATS